MPPARFRQTLSGKRVGQGTCPQARRRSRLRLADEEMQAVESLYASGSAAPILNEEQHYEQCWASALVGCALARLGAEFGEGPKGDVFEELKPFLCGGAGTSSQEEVARRLEMPVNTLRSHLSRLRGRYGELLRAEVARTIGRGDDLDEELRHLREILVES